MPNENSEEVVSRCVVDIISRKVRIYSNPGNERTVECETTEEFMNVLQFVRSEVTEGNLFYSNLF